jgi:abhydrolase domain-containing protein 6
MELAQGLAALEKLELSVGKAQYRALTSVVRRLARVKRGDAVIEGVHVPYFVRDGVREPILLIHGFGGDKEGWLLMASMLAWRRGLVIPDLPGFGAAGAIPKRAASAANQARVLASLLDELEIRRVHLVGNSMGGGIALRFASDFPTRAASMTLIGSVGPTVEKSEVGLAIDRGENPLITESVDDLDRLLRLVAEKVPPSSRAMRRHLGADRYARRDAQALLFDGWNDPPSDESVPKDLAKILTPTLVIHGECDRVIHPATGKALARELPNARLELLPAIGHVPQLEAPKLTAALIDAFIARLG